MSFQVNPLTDDLIAIKNQTAISRSIRNLVLTAPGERFFNNEVGSRVNELLFETVDDITAASIKSEIENTIQNYEPRVRLDEVKTEPNFDNHSFDVTITYTIVGIDAPPQQLNFALQATR